MSDVVLEATDLVKVYPVRQGGALMRRPGHLRAVCGVSLRLHHGEILGIVGESGCGKSTLAKLLTAHERPTSGEVRLLGRPLHELRGRQLRAARRDVQLVFQDPYASLDPRMRVGDQVKEPLIVHRGLAPRGQADGRVRELFNLVGLDDDHLTRYPHELSGGQRQRVGIARALALRPRVLVCDEAVSALDVSVQAQILGLLKSLQAELGVAYVFISHDLSVVAHLAHRVAVMYLGSVVETGSISDVYDGVRHPYTRALLSAVPVPDPADRDQRRLLPLLEGEPPNPLSPPAGCAFHPRCPIAQGVCREEVPALLSSGNHLAACHVACSR